MMQEKCLSHVPRVLLSLVFVIGGLGFLMNFSGTVKYVGMGLSPWGLAGLATAATVVAIVLKLGGGIMLLLNYRPATAAWMLIAFTALASLLYHLSWGGDGGQMQMTQFLKNLAIIGGLFMFTHCGSGTCCATETAQEKD